MPKAAGRICEAREHDDFSSTAFPARNPCRIVRPAVPLWTLARLFPHGPLARPAHDGIAPELSSGSHDRRGTRSDRSVPDSRQVQSSMTANVGGPNDTLANTTLPIKAIMKGKGIWGLWEIPPTWRGGFHIWPEAMGDPTSPRLTEAIDEPTNLKPTQVVGSGRGSRVRTSRNINRLLLPRPEETRPRTTRDFSRLCAKPRGLRDT